MDEVIAENPAAVADVRAGEQKAIGFLTGQVMKKTRGQANAGLVQQLIRAHAGGRLSMGLVGLLLILGGIAAIAIGALQVRGPLATIRHLDADGGQPRALRDVARQADRGRGRRSHRCRRDACARCASACCSGAAVIGAGVVLIVLGLVLG